MNAGDHFQIEHRVHIRHRDVDQMCTFGQDYVSMTIIWHQPYAGSLQNAILVVREFDQQLILPQNHMHLHQPRTLKETKYFPEVSRAREYGWRLERGPESFIVSRDLATQLVIQLLDLIERDRTWKIRRNDGY